MPPTNLPLRRLAPHRKFAKKFLTLPDELLYKISDEVTPEDLPNFRLTCKTLANIAAKHFGEKRLARRRFMFTEYSLEALVEMTAHPIIGPCIKSILFGTSHLTNELTVLMDVLDAHKITDEAEAMQILQMYRERHNKQVKFLKTDGFSYLLYRVCLNLSSHGTNVALGIFNERQEHRKTPCHGYGYSHEFGGLPFTRLTISSQHSFLREVRRACRRANLHPEVFEFDLLGQQIDDGMSTALSDLLLSGGQHRLLARRDVCIREGDMDIRILSSRSRLEFKQRPVRNQMLSIPEDICFDLHSLGRPMRDAIAAMSLTHLHMESCSMFSGEFVDVLESLAGTLQAVELIDVALWGDQSNIVNMDPILNCLRHDLRLHTLVLDDVRAMNKDYSGDTGITLTKGRSWHGSQQIHAGLDILAGYDGNAWDDDLDDWFEDGIRDFENRISIEYHDQHYPAENGHEDLAYKAQEESNLEDYKREYEEYKVSRASAMEAMARVEARDFSS
ncbi:hypothetical protein E4T49_03241 [Aureobasidium sp. EXF-10728]|nr:hypothetical protein E4T49_03241 [Aureobasidium sp. EXF-10728]